MNLSNDAIVAPCPQPESDQEPGLRLSRHLRRRLRKAATTEPWLSHDAFAAMALRYALNQLERGKATVSDLCGIEEGYKGRGGFKLLDSLPA